MTDPNEGKIRCIIDGAAGIYVPRQFVSGFDLTAWGINEESAAILRAGPGHLCYWDVWEDVLNNAEMKGDDGKKWTLYQDSDLFAIREDFNWDKSRF